MQKKKSGEFTDINLSVLCLNWIAANSVNTVDEIFHWTLTTWSNAAPPPSFNGSSLGAWDNLDNLDCKQNMNSVLVNTHSIFS